MFWRLNWDSKFETKEVTIKVFWKNTLVYRNKNPRCKAEEAWGRDKLRNIRGVLLQNLDRKFLIHRSNANISLFEAEITITWRSVTAILYCAHIVAWALMSAPRDWSFANARKASSKHDNASGSWFCSRWTSPVLKQNEAAAPRGTCNEENKKNILRGRWESYAYKIINIRKNNRLNGISKLLSFSVL